MNLVLLGVLLVVWAAAVWFFHRYRIWPLYYIVGAVGGAYWFIFAAGTLLGLETWLAGTIAQAVHQAAALLGIPTRIFEGAPGVLLVMVVFQDVGWTILQIGVESSGLLEIGVLANLLLFYPGWSRARRWFNILSGCLAIWFANILRMLLIVVLLNRMGKEALVLAHTYIGKGVFFVLAILIFWYLITYSTMKDLQPAGKPAR